MTQGVKGANGADQRNAPADTATTGPDGPAGEGESVSALAARLGLAFAQAPTLADSVLHGLFDLPADVSLGPASAALLAPGFVQTAATEQTEEVALDALRGGLATETGGVLTPLYNVVAGARPDQIWASRQAVGGQTRPASLLMFGAPMAVSGPSGFRESLVLHLADEVTQARFTSIAELHGACQAGTGGAGRGGRQSAPSAGTTFAQADAAVGRTRDREGFTVLQAAGRPEGRQLHPLGYQFRFGPHYCRLSPRRDVEGREYLVVQMFQDRPASRPVMMRPAGYSGPHGTCAAQARLAIALVGTVSAPPAIVYSDAAAALQHAH
jgi:hypothetical protein